MKSDELQFLKLLQERDGLTVRDLIQESGIPPKRCWHLLSKWTRKGWYDWGVNIDLGWLTDEGKAAMR